MRTRPTRSLIALLGALLLVACQAGSPAPSPSATPTGEPLTEAQAKYAVLAQLGTLWYCDPDFYPIQVREEQEAALEHWPEILADADAFEAILQHLDWNADRQFTDADKLTAYREWKILRALPLQVADRGLWRFDVLWLPEPTAQTGFQSQGTVTDFGQVTVEVQEPSTGPACPICLARGTLIDTPAGPVPVERLRIGDLVWTTDTAGARIAAPIERLGSAPVPSTHRVVHLVLDDGRQAWVSPGHPLADGRRLGDVRRGDLVDGARVVSAELVAYAGGATFDLLPAGGTGAYWANGILLGSTLAR